MTFTQEYAKLLYTIRCDEEDKDFDDEDEEEAEDDEILLLKTYSLPKGNRI